MISENAIKKAAIQFLTNHYKFRSRIGDTETKIDQRSDGNIIADAYLTFPVKEGQKFVATVEATSAESKDEVIYQSRFSLLWLDSLMWGSILGTAVFVFLYETSRLLLRPHGMFYNLLIVFGLILFFAFAYFLIFRKRNKYSYIYAIEQFKQYFADDQWIALGEDVFDHHKNEDFEELKEQCILNGIGLMIVHENKETMLLIAPARQNEISQSRQLVRFDDSKKSIRDRTLQSMKTGWNKLNKVFTKNVESYSVDRFKTVSLLPVFWTLCCLGIVGYILGVQWMDKPFRYVNDKEWQKEIEGVGDEKEPKSYIINRKLAKPPEEREGTYLDVLPYEEIKRDPYIGDIESFIATDSRLFTYYDCERLYNLDSDRYMISLVSFEEFDDAKNKVLNLTQKGIRSNLVWHGCFKSDIGGYIVFLDLLQNTNEAAIEIGAKLKMELEEKGEETEEMKIVMVRR